jgi:Tol biopolymer transport system component
VYAAWSADWSTSDIWIINVDGSNAQPLVVANTANVETYPSWSPDGQWIAFTTVENNRTRICFVRVDGTGTRNCPIDQGNHPSVWNYGGISWTADSQNVLYRVINEGVSAGVFVAPLGSGTAQELIGDDEFGSWISWPYLSSDGSTILLSSSLNSPEARAYMVKPNQAPVAITSGPGHEWNQNFYEVR